MYLLGDTPVNNFDAMADVLDGGGFGGFDNILENAVLAPFQTTALALAYLSKSSLCSLSTGLGKTFIAMGFCRIIADHLKGKTIFVCESSNLDQTKQKFLKNTKLLVRTVDGTSKNIMNVLSQEPIYDVYIVSYEGMRDFRLHQYFVSIKDKIKAIIVDECQNLGNLSSDISQIIKEVNKHIEYRLFLSATALRSNPEQFINVMHILDETFISNPSKFINKYRETHMDGSHTYKDLDELARVTCRKVINISRKDLGIQGDYKPKLISGYPNAKERKYSLAQRTDLKSRVDSDVMQKLITTLIDLKFRNKKGIIFCNTNKNKDILKEVLTANGLITDIRDGSHTKTRESKKLVENRFTSGELDCLICNAQTGLDLQCDFVIFWELTSDFYQTLGRGERGLKGNDIEVYMCVVRHTVDVKYFRERVRTVSNYLGDIFNQCTEIVDKFDSLITMAELEDEDEL